MYKLNKLYFLIKILNLKIIIKILNFNKFQFIISKVHKWSPRWSISYILTCWLLTCLELRDPYSDLRSNGVLSHKGLWEHLRGQPTARRNVATLRYFADYNFIRGYNIGQRLIDEYLAKTQTAYCKNFKETALAIAEVKQFQK